MSKPSSATQRASAAPSGPSSTRWRPREPAGRRASTAARSASRSSGSGAGSSTSGLSVWPAIAGDSSARMCASSALRRSPSALPRAYRSGVESRRSRSSAIDSNTQAAPASVSSYSANPPGRTPMVGIFAGASRLPRPDGVSPTISAWSSAARLLVARPETRSSLGLNPLLDVSGRGPCRRPGRRAPSSSM